jgi:hypothetical protein
MMMQTDIPRHFADAYAPEQQFMSLLRMGLDQVEFLVGQLARLVKNFHWNHGFAKVVQQSGHASIASLLLVQPEFASKGNHQGADGHRVHEGVVIRCFQASQTNQCARIT